jgi:Transcriptional regulatory protein, C terminal/Helix-turn-helix domain
MPKRKHDEKFENLLRKGALNARSQVVIDELFASGGFFDPCDVVQVKYEMLRRVANGQPVTEALHAFGFSSHDAFYKARAAFEQSGLVGLIPARRGPRKENELSRARKSAKNSIGPAHTPFQEMGDSCAVLVNRFVSDDLEIDFLMRKVRVRGENVRLTPKEFELLRYLVSQPGRPVPHRELIHFVWGSESDDQIDYLRVFITYLRRKIELNPAKPQYILTEPWVGYRFMALDA